MLEGRTGRRGGMGLVGARRTDTPDGRTVDTKERKPFGFLDAASSFGFALSWRRVAAGADQRAKERTHERVTPNIHTRSTFASSFVYGMCIANFFG